VTLRRSALTLALAVVLAGAIVPFAWAQIARPGAVPGAPSAAEPPKDALGRDTPRGMLQGFMAAARKDNFAAAAMYLDTPFRGEAAQDLARQLYQVLDARLPPRLPEISDVPEGAAPDPLKPDQDILGSIAAPDGHLDIVVTRARGPSGRVWQFSRQTLQAIPPVYSEVQLIAAHSYLGPLLTGPRLGGIRLFNWVLFGLGLPLLYVAIGWAARSFRHAAPGPLRLIAIVIASRAVLHLPGLPLIERQFWTTISALLAVAAVVWLIRFITRTTESHVARRMPPAAFGDTMSLLRVSRWAVDAVVVVVAVLAVLDYFGINATAALAGLGIGGIAVALAAQKTLENVIGGLSIILDRAVRVGDFLKVDGRSGTVEYVGLRSTRIRMLDRSMLSVPNGQLAGASIETISDRDKFEFRHCLRLSYDTTAAQLRAIPVDLRQLLVRHPSIEQASVRVRFVQLGPSSFDIELAAYLMAQDWNHFLEIQEGLLLDSMEIVDAHGATIALPAQIVQVADGRSRPQEMTGVAAPAAYRLRPRPQPGRGAIDQTAGSAGN
jgi:MscS family membrane protein